MKHVSENKDKIPAYLRLYRQFRKDIVNGAYPYHSKLPSKRSTAEETGVSTVTVEHAYALLSDEGYIEAKERSGYYVIFRSADGFAVSSEREKPPVSLQRHEDEPYPFPFSVLAKAMRSVITNEGEGMMDKSPNAGLYGFRRAIGMYLARSRGIFADPDQIIVGSGSEYLYRFIIELLGRNKIFAIEAPSYNKIEQVYRASNVSVEMLQLGADGIESTALWNSGADVLHISPYRSFPSGVSASASKRYEYLRWADSGNRYIVEDDFESEFSVSKKPEETLFSHTQSDNVIYMNTFSKTISPSFRVSYMVLPMPLVPEFESKLGFYSCTVPTYIQAVLTELLTNGDFERHINRVRRQRRKELAEGKNVKEPAK